MSSRTPRNAGGRKGTGLVTALAFAVAALLLTWLAINSLAGPYAGTPRRQLLAVLSIVFAMSGLAVAVAVMVGVLRDRRKLREHLRLAEQIVGMFPAELLDLGDDDTALRTRPIGLTLTNQRLLIHEPARDPQPKVSFEHEDIAAAIDRGPTPGDGLRRCALYEFDLRDGRMLSMRMDASASIDFRRPREQYLDERKREVRAIVIEAHGPTPSRPGQKLDTILVDGRPTVCLLELNENYLRVTGEHSPPLADLYYYFHWEHMDVGQVQPAGVEGLPEDWRRLRLTPHGTSELTICGSERTVRRVWQKAASCGAVTA